MELAERLKDIEQSCGYINRAQEATVEIEKLTKLIEDQCDEQEDRHESIRSINEQLRELAGDAIDALDDKESDLYDARKEISRLEDRLKEAEDMNFELMKDLEEGIEAYEGRV